MESQVQHLGGIAISPVASPVLAAEDAAARRRQNHLTIIRINGQAIHILKR